MLKILIADDHDIIRKGINLVLQEHSEIDVVAEAQEPETLFQHLKHCDVDVLILDLSFPDHSGFDILKQVRTNYPELPILIFTMYDEEQYAVRLLKAGASGFLNKGESSEKLIEALLKLGQGRRYFSHDVAEQLLNEPFSKLHAHHQILTDREYEIFILLAEGKKNLDIAKKLFISPKTVSTYTSRILDKLELENKTEIVHYAIKHELLLEV